MPAWVWIALALMLAAATYGITRSGGALIKADAIALTFNFVTK